ncbi:alpha/beta hydrolase-fold protein [Dactylosporangium sp. NPDC000555]|uniref:alpha/beta hydrolase-fold protein n=1 Tax=Dactylosporangium sp. NPDC000555 TaxID=3154260 RepID=UPI003323264F
MSSHLIRDVFQDPLVEGEVPYAVLTPEGWTSDETLPLILFLHAANSSSDFLAMVQSIADGAWANGSLPRSVIASASTPTTGGFYIDRAGNGWESLIATAFPRLLEKQYGADLTRVSLMGSSMGGYGALKIAFAEPSRWLAVAAVAPALLPVLTPEEVRARNTLDVLARLSSEMADEGGGFAANSVLHRLRGNADAVRASGLPIFLRCGDADVFAMQDGTEQLHRALWDLDIGHEYHLVHGADHLGPEAISALRAALAFIGAAQRRAAGEDRTAADRELEAAWRDWAAGGRQGDPPKLDAFGVSASVALRAMLEPELAEAVRRDPTTARRYGILPD